MEKERAGRDGKLVGFFPASRCGKLGNLRPFGRRKSLGPSLTTLHSAESPEGGSRRLRLGLHARCLSCGFLEDLEG